MIAPAMAASPSNSDGLDKAFQRRSRPQLPVVQLAQSHGTVRPARILNVTSSKSWDPTPPTRAVSQGHRDRPIRAEWADFVQFGTLTQAGVDLQLCVRRQSNVTLIMFKRLETKDDRVWKRVLAFDHPNLAQVLFTIDTDDGLFLSYAFARFTLEELWSVHKQMDETHLRAIAQAVLNLHVQPIWS